MGIALASVVVAISIWKKPKTKIPIITIINMAEKITGVRSDLISIVVY